MINGSVNLVIWFIVKGFNSRWRLVGIMPLNVFEEMRIRMPASSGGVEDAEQAVLQGSRWLRAGSPDRP